MKYREQFFYIGKKIVVFLCSLLVLSVLVFTISRLTPTDPLQSYYGERVEKMSVEEKEAAREKLGLNDPVPTQYFRWVQNALQGDWYFVQLHPGILAVAGFYPAFQCDLENPSKQWCLQHRAGSESGRPYPPSDHADGGGDTGASLVLRLHDPKPASGGNQTGLCAAL